MRGEVSDCVALHGTVAPWEGGMVTGANSTLQHATPYGRVRVGAQCFVQAQDFVRRGERRQARLFVWRLEAARGPVLVKWSIMGGATWRSCTG